jgi:hypothetical protein
MNEENGFKKEGLKVEDEINETETFKNSKKFENRNFVTKDFNCNYPGGRKSFLCFFFI